MVMVTTNKCVRYQRSYRTMVKYGGEKGKNVLTIRISRQKKGMKKRKRKGAEENTMQY